MTESQSYYLRSAGQDVASIMEATEHLARIEQDELKRTIFESITFLAQLAAQSIDNVQMGTAFSVIVQESEEEIGLLEAAATEVEEKVEHDRRVLKAISNLCYAKS